MSQDSSRIFSYPALVAGAFAAEEMMRPMQGPWQTANGSQEKFLTSFLEPCRAAMDRLPEIERIASWSHEEINQFLLGHGQTIQLSPFGPDTFGVAAVLKVALQWVKEGTVDAVYRRGLNYPAFRLEHESVTFGHSQMSAYPFAKILAKNDDQVYLSKAMPGWYDLEEFALTAHALRIVQTLEMSKGYEGVVAPMIGLDQSRNVDWIIGMNTLTKMRGSTECARIIEALIQIKWKMNHQGAILDTSAAMALCLEVMQPPRNDVVIDDTFLLIVMRDGLSIPLVTGIITPEDWKDPGPLF